MRVGEITIEEVDLPSLSEDDVVRLNAFANELRAEAHPDDPPRPVDYTRANVRTIPDFIAVREFWAREADGDIAASAQASFMRTEQNRHVLEAEIEVRPDRRRRGLAKALLGVVAGVATEEERTLLIASTSERVPAGEAFARRVGAEPALANHVNRLLTASVDRELMRRWIDEGPERAPGYELVAIDGRYPDELVEGVCALVEVMNTAPRDDLEVEDMPFTVDYARQFERTLDARGTERWSLFARHVATGELVGYTEVFWSPVQPRTIGQGDTAVRPDHRGRALGKWLKATMLERILHERPDVEDVRTGNADSNDAMLGINRAMGFEPYEAQIVWQVPLERVRSYLEG